MNNSVDANALSDKLIEQLTQGKKFKIKMKQKNNDMNVVMWLE